MIRFFIVSLAIGALACDVPPSPPPAPAPVPAPYPRPPVVTVDDLAKALPRDAGGQPILLTVDGTPLTIGAKRVDPIGAAATCRDLKNDCMQATGDGDACVAGVKRCATAEPWLEAEPCCPSACVEAYQEQRRLGATPVAANSAVFGSTHECFPGLQDQYRAAGGKPYLAPRLRQ